MNKILLGLLAVGTAALASPAAAVTVEVSGSPNTGCASALFTPNANSCAGYYSNNQFNNANVAQQQAAIDLLIGAGNYTVNWSSLVANGKVVSGGSLSALNSLLSTAGGQVILGLHWGNGSGLGSGNVSAFYLWNNVPAGAITLGSTQGYSNAVLYQSVTTAVPEPGTWALMLLGFGAVGVAIRRRRARNFLPQVA